MRRNNMCKTPTSSYYSSLILVHTALFYFACSEMSLLKCFLQLAVHVLNLQTLFVVQLERPLVEECMDHVSRQSVRLILTFSLR